MEVSMFRIGALGVAAVIGLSAPGVARPDGREEDGRHGRHDRDDRHERCERCEARGAWVAGDFHQHSLYTDGSTPFDDVMAKSDEFGLDWWANSEHGGSRNRDGNGVFWDTYTPNPILGDVATSGGHQVMWRWQSLRDFVFPDLLRARAAYPDKAILSGLEWNVPGHEHCGTGIVARDASALSAFEFMFDGSDADTSRVGEVTPWGVLSKRNGRTYPGHVGKPYPERHADAVAACAWMQEQYDAGRIEAGWIVFAHVERAGAWSPERGGGYNVEHFRDFNDAGPDVCFGFEGAPGHQVNEFRGLGNTVTCEGGACTSSDFGGTYGGVGFYTAKVGGLWDALLGEGRRFFNFASSDYHRHHTAGGDDFYPGEYQKDWLYARDADRDGELSRGEIADGLRSGRSFFVQGDLVDRLELTVSQGAERAAMGETLEASARRGAPLKVRIRFHSPERNANGDAPAVDHVDLIAGRITGRLDPSDPAYTDPTNASTQVIASFTSRDWTVDEDGSRTIDFVLKDVREDTYLRVRGTNVPCGTPDETGPATSLPSAEFCSPLADALAGPNDAQKAFADLWFYSNPVFVDVRR